MASTYSTNLKLELIGTGDQSGTWGATTNTNLGSLIEEAIAGYVTQAVTDGAATVLTIPDGTSSNGRNYVIELTGTLSANRTVEVPAVDKPYIFFNNTSGGYSVTVKVSGQTGVTIANGKKAIVYTNSTDVIEVVNAPVSEAGTQTLTNKTINGSNNTVTNISLTSGVTGTLPTANGGTNLTSFTANGAVYASSTSALTTGTLPTASGGTALTSFTANGAMYASSTTALTTGTLPVASGGTGITSFGTGVATALGQNVTGSGSIALSASPTFTGTVSATAITLAGSSSAASTKLPNILETATVSATAATGTINYDAATQSVLYYTSNASANWTLNIRASSGTSLNTFMATGDTLTIVHLVTQGSTAYYNSAVQVDGSSVTPKWQGGTAPTSGNASAIDVYTYTVIKTASATFTVLASQTQFK
jgi:hypothetical protein